MAQSSPLQFDIPGMTSDDDAQAITRAVQKIDPDASVSADLESKRVVIGGEGEAHDFMQAIEDAGFEVKAAG